MIECIFCVRKYFFLWMYSRCSGTSLNLCQAVCALFWYTVFVCFFHVGVTSRTSRVQTDWGSMWFLTSTSTKLKQAPVLCHPVVFPSFTTRRVLWCFTRIFSTLCTNCQWSREAAVCGLFTKMTVKQLLCSSGLTKAGFTRRQVAQICSFYSETPANGEIYPKYPMRIYYALKNKVSLNKIILTC